MRNFLKLNAKIKLRTKRKRNINKNLFFNCGILGAGWIMPEQVQLMCSKSNLNIEIKVLIHQIFECCGTRYSLIKLLQDHVGETTVF